MSTHLQGFGQICTEACIMYSGSVLLPRASSPPRGSVANHSSTAGMPARLGELRAQAEQSLCKAHGRMAAPLPCRSQQKAEWFSLLSQAHSRQATAGNRQCWLGKRFAFAAFCHKAVGLVPPKAVLTHHVHYQMATHETPVS